MAQLVRNLPAVWETWVHSLGWEDPLEKGKATHSSVLENSRGCIVHGVVKSQTRLSNQAHKHIAFMGFPGGSDSKESACNVGDLGSIPGLRRSPGGGHVNLLQYSCLENPMD